MPRSKPISFNNVSNADINKFKAGLEKYDYIQKHIADNSDFRNVYASFYFVPKFIINEQNQQLYFSKMFLNRPNDPIAFADLLKEAESDKYYFSFATKAVHTFNPESPIYDSHVVAYLVEQENVPLKTAQCKNNFVYNWPLIKKWYREFEKDPRYKEWINWFDKQFPQYTWLTSTKKIDFIIYVLGVE